MDTPCRKFPKSFTGDSATSNFEGGRHNRFRPSTRQTILDHTVHRDPETSLANNPLRPASNRCAQMGRPPAATPRSISREIKNWINRFSAVHAIAICPKCAGIHDPRATPERGALALDPSDSHPLRLKCSKCKKHLAAASQLKTAVVIAEVPFPPEQAECPCNPDEFLALSTTTANIKDDLNETRQILQKTRDERDELRLEVEKLKSIPDPKTATGAGAAEDTDTGNVHQEAEDQDIPNHEQEPRDLQAPTTDLNGTNI